MKSFSCYTAAIGSSSLVGISESQFIHHFNKDVYFSYKVPSLSTHYHSLGKLRKAKVNQGLSYQIAYLVTIYDVDSLRSAKAIIPILNDGMGIFLIQPINFPGFYRNHHKVLTKWAKSNGNIYVAEERQNGVTAR